MKKTMFVILLVVAFLHITKELLMIRMLWHQWLNSF